MLHDLLGITGPPAEPGQRRPSATASRGSRGLGDGLSVQAWTCDVQALNDL